MTQSSMSGKVALVTGAGSGIGRAAAQRLAERGAVVCCGDLNLDGAQETVRSIVRQNGSAFACKLDVTVEADWQEVLGQIASDPGRLDVLVNCVGLSFASPVTEMSLSDWRRVMAVNLDSVFLGTKHSLPMMRATGGSIVNVASASGIKAAAGASAYSASKAAVVMFTKAAAKECGEQGLPVRVNCVCPGGVKTPMWQTMPFFHELVQQEGSPEAAFNKLAGTIPAGRFAEPDEIAQAIVYLASDEAKYITGIELVVDGGYVHQYVNGVHATR